MTLKIGDIVKNAPNALIWPVTVIVLGLIAAFVVLSVTGSSTDALWMFINRAANIAGAVFSGGAVIIAGAAAKSSHNAEVQTKPEDDETTPVK